MRKREKTAELPPDVIDGFFSNIRKEPDTGCWIWAGVITTSGYGYINIKDGKRWTSIMARQVSFILHHGRLPNHHHLVNSCDNKLCVAPDHLHEGTIKYDVSTINHTNKDCQCNGKKCYGCGKVLCKGMFHNKSSTYDGLATQCTKCSSDETKRIRYNLSREEYKILIDHSGGKCEICDRITDYLVVDHNHYTQMARGMICQSCNSSLPSDDPAWTAKMKMYMKKYRQPLIDIALSLEG